jgi:hypothetical protein
MMPNANPLALLTDPETVFQAAGPFARRQHDDPQTGEYEMTDKTAIQRIQELDRERAALFEQTKEETRRARQAAAPRTPRPIA